MPKLVTDPSLRVQNLSAIEVEQIEPIDFMSLVRRIWYGKFTILCVTVLSITLAGYYAFAIATPRFAAVATLKIGTNSDPLRDNEAAALGLSMERSALNTEVAVLTSRHLLEQVIAELDLLDDPAFNRYLVPIVPWSLTALRNGLRDMLTGVETPTPDDAAILDKTIENLASTLSIRAVRDTYIFEIWATTGNPEMSAQIANQLAQHYLADQVAFKQQSTAQRFDWLAARVYDLQMSLEQKETRINEMIVADRADDATAFDALSRQSVETRSRLADIRAALGEAEAKLLRSDASLTSAAIPEKQRLEADVRRFSEQAQALEAFQGSLDHQLAAQSASRIRLQQLRREADATRVLYETFLARLQETRVQQDLQQADSRILSLASPGKYVAPRKMLILAIAALLGLCMGVLGVLTRHALRRGFHSAEALAEGTGLRVLTQIPRLRRGKPHQWLGYLNAKPASVASEAVRNLRTSLLLADPTTMPQVILSTSSVAGEGKTTLSVALAHNLSGLGKSVLLFETDMRQPCFARYLQCEAQDLGAVISGKHPLEAAISRDPRLAADVLAGRPTSQNPADQFSGAAFSKFIADLRTRYDFIILDAPPVLPVPDARILAQVADSITYAVRWERTDQRLVHAGIRALEDVNAKISGVILSQVDLKRLKRYGGIHPAQYGDAYFQN